MRTKHLLTAMALPVIFAACTNDELEVVSNDVTALEGRLAAENVTLDFENLNPESRLVYGNDGYTWQANDQIGACLMDVITDDYHAIGTHWSEWFDMVDHIHTNYKFTRNSAGDWTTEAKMSEGNYFFYYPYDANQGLRNAYRINRANQVLNGTDASNLKKAYVNNNAFVGYGKVYAGDNNSESVKINMVPVFGATGITLKKVGTVTYTIEKIVLRGTAIANEVVIDPTQATTATQYHSLLTDDNDDSPSLVDVRSDSWNWFNAAQYVADDIYDPAYVSNSSGWYNKTNALKDVLVYNDEDENVIEVELKGGNVLRTEADKVDIIVMLKNEVVNPLGDTAESDDIAADNQVVLDIHTDKGLIRDIKLAYKYTATSGDLADENRNITNVITDHAIVGVGDGEKVTVTFDDTSLDKPHNMEITGDDELANLIHWNKDNQTDITAVLKSNVTLTKAMYNEYASSLIKSLTMDGGSDYQVTIASDVPATALDKITFKSIANVKVMGTQTLAQNNGATNIEVRGTLNVTGNNKNFIRITNYGVLNVQNNMAGGEILNYATMNVAAGKTIKNTTSVTNGYPYYYFGEINNAGTIQKLVNTVYGNVTNTGMLGEYALTADAVNVNVTNAGTIENNVEGKVYVSQNTGNIYANDKSATIVKTNSKNIIITELDENDGNFLTETLGNIVQEITTNADTDVVDARANTIWLSATLNVLEVKDAAGNVIRTSLNHTKADGTAHYTTIVAKGKNARIEGNGREFVVHAYVVEDDAVLTFNKVKAYTHDKPVYMYGGTTGDGSKKATLTVNSNASLVIFGSESKAIPVYAAKGATSNILNPWGTVKFADFTTTW